MARTLDRFQLRDLDDLDGPLGLIYDAEVTRSTDATLHFKIPAFSPVLEFGPAPYPRPPRITRIGGGLDPHQHDIPDMPQVEENPPSGTRCAVAFHEGDADRPLVLAIFGWPG